MSATRAPLDRENRVWKALSDPTRRQILDALREEPRTTGQLVARFEMTRFGVMKHLGVLTGAGLVLVERRGRERWNLLNAVPIQDIYRRWIRPFEPTDVAGARAADRLIALRDSIETRALPETLPVKNFDTPPFGVIELTLEIEINADPERVWQAMTADIAKWWPRAFNAGQTPVDFVLEPVLGGHMLERWENGGAIWATVTGVEENAMLQLSGELSPEFCGPARTLTRITLEADANGTRLRLNDTVYGRTSDDGAGSLEGGWQELFGGCLKPWVEEGRQPDEPVTAA